MQKCWPNFAFHTASVHPAVMATWCTDPRLGSKAGSIVRGCIDAHLARGKVKSVVHALSWSLDSKQLPLLLPLGSGVITVHYIRIMEKLDAPELFMSINTFNSQI